MPKIIIYKILHKIFTKDMESGNKIPLTFITGNKKKLEEFMSIIVGSPLEAKYEVTNQTLDLDEL